MSDFSNPAHDFKGYIAKLTEDLPQPLTKGNRKSSAPLGGGEKQIQLSRRETFTESNAIEFEDILFYVCLPDFNNFKELPHGEVRTLFEWLRFRGVTTIRSLDIPDSTVHPMSDILLKGAVLDKFEVNKLVWRKLDMNLDILVKSDFADKITDLTLYSSGNWSVLYHWVSEEGLVKLTAVGNLFSFDAVSSALSLFSVNHDKCTCALLVNPLRLKEKKTSTSDPLMRYNTASACHH